MRLDDISTPALLLHREVLERNINAMAARAQRLGVRLRPHVKTHKCTEIARLQRLRGATGVTVSTLAEARVFAAAGFDDQIWAFPLAPAKVSEALQIAREITLRLVVDGMEGAEALERGARDAGLRPWVWMKVDCGYHRAGVDPRSDGAVALAARLSSSRTLRFQGLLTHAGHAYGATGEEQRRSIAAAERDTLVELAGRLREKDIEVAELSLGSTPTLQAVDHLDGIDEARPGNYVFHDLTQAAIGSCSPEDIAVSVLATVVSRHASPERLVIDAGALALSKDAGRDDGWPGMGGVCHGPKETRPDPGLILESLSQEHGVVRPSAGSGGIPGSIQVGDRLRILPNHSCLTAACHERLHVVDGEDVQDLWTIHRLR